MSVVPAQNQWDDNTVFTNMLRLTWLTLRASARYLILSAPMWFPQSCRVRSPYVQVVDWRQASRRYQLSSPGWLSVHQPNIVRLGYLNGWSIVSFPWVPTQNRRNNNKVFTGILSVKYLFDIQPISQMNAWVTTTFRVLPQVQSRKCLRKIK